MKIRLLIGALSAVFLTGVGHAADYPERPIKVLVGYTAGGSGDSIARIVTGAMSQILGQPIVVENRPGAGGTIVANALANAPKDGYTLGLGTGNQYGVDQYVYKASYTPEDFTPINLLARYPLILAVNAEKGPKTFKEFEERVKANPDSMFYSSSGIGGSPHTSSVMLQDYMGAKFTNVAYKGGNPALLAVAAGDVDFSMGTAPSVLPLGAPGGKIRMLAVSSAERSKIAPELPTIAESGVPNFEYGFWFGLFGPAGLPADVVKKLHEATVVALADPEVQKKLIIAGSEASPFKSPEAFDAYARENGAFTLDRVKKAKPLD